MKKFNGFTSSETFAQIPNSFFSQLLNEIEDADELKVTLYFLWRVEQMESPFRGLRESDFESESLGMKDNEIRRGLEKALLRGSILKSTREADVCYFLNSPRGRASVEAFEKGQWKESAKGRSMVVEKSNAFKLYEENIGALTPLIADMLRDAEKTYPAAWIEEAFEIAVSLNVRNWKYIEAILKRWKEKGKDERKNKQDVIKDAERYTDSEFSEFFNRDE